jgi:hypothetical protein
MKITIKAEPKEIAALVKELEGQQEGASKIKSGGPSFKTIIDGQTGRSEIMLTAGKGTIQAGKLSGDTIAEVNRRLGELCAEKNKIDAGVKELDSCEEKHRRLEENIATQIEESQKWRWDPEWAIKQAAYLEDVCHKQAQRFREEELKKQNQKERERDKEN